MRSYRLKSDTDRWLESEFCIICGTTVTWRGEFLPGRRGIAGGTFDQPSFWYTPERLVFARTKPDWLDIHDHIPAFEAMPV
jgi:hypothetical protein